LTGVTDLKQAIAELAQQLQASLAERDELLLQQAATAEILKVINSSPGNLAPVFEAILEKAHGLCAVTYGSLQLYDGNEFRAVAVHGLSVAFAERLRQGYVPGPNHQSRRLMEGKRFAQTPDIGEIDDPTSRAAFEHSGIRTALFIPLRKEGRLIGQIVAARREVRPFNQKEIALLENFAAQAVIAMENARLFNETKESLQQQTATADVLKVISRSAFDLQSVLDTLVTSASTLCSADQGMLLLLEDGVLKPLSYFGPYADRFEFRKSLASAPHRGTISGRAVLEGHTAHVPDVLSDPEFTNNSWQQLTGFRAMLAVPLMRQGQPIGAMALSRTKPGLFADRQIELVTTFTDQAVIAIENVRLFNEVQAKTRDLSEALTYQTGSSNILSVIASSPTDVAPVLKAIVESACELCEAYDAVMFLKDGGDLHPSAHHGSIPMDLEKLPIGRNSASGRAILDRKPVHVHDYLSADGDDFPVGRERARREGARSVLGVPLSREGESIGVIVLRRIEVHPFSDKQISLLQTFADQAVIAIGNVRLFEQVQQRTRELSQSLDDLRTAQERLIQTEKLASLGQLTAGIAHEIKNPLNFVNNFSALSAELIDEMKEALSDISLDNNKREELNEIAQMLKSNLEKVVQHGKRADSIVKNMLQHSREGSGEHRPADINAVVDESLNLAYHGARAEKAGFTITLERKFDPAVGMVDVYPQEITRALLNLISNGFYATTKRKAEAGDGFEPMLSATTRSLGDKVEIRIRDNGIGIPEEVKEKIFNPFFTTKPSGEGTGLGLSMSHDIIVKQHGGSIDLETKSGLFTEFKIVLPRTSKR
jgi:two-component system NtrC family sensor kinase